jgi:Na+-translocating ferredoxin:NAD+ oxidoreductase RnfE subunit
MFGSLRSLRRAAAVALVIALIATSAAAAVADDKVAYNTKSHIYHCLTCYHVPACTKNCIVITRADAIARGGRPCKHCGGSCKNPRR